MLGLCRCELLCYDNNNLLVDAAYCNCSLTSLFHFTYVKCSQFSVKAAYMACTHLVISMMSAWLWLENAKKQQKENILGNWNGGGEREKGCARVEALECCVSALFTRFNCDCHHMNCTYMETIV